MAFRILHCFVPVKSLFIYRVDSICNHFSASKKGVYFFIENNYSIVICRFVYVDLSVRVKSIILSFAFAAELYFACGKSLA